MAKSRSLTEHFGNLLRCLSRDKPRQWNTCLAQAKFAYNYMQNKSTGKCPFEVVYTKLPRLTFDLTNLPSIVDLSKEAEYMVDRIQQLHQVIDHLEKANASDKTKADEHKIFQSFQPGDLVMVFLRKTRLPASVHNKLSNKKVPSQCQGCLKTILTIDSYVQQCSYQVHKT